MTRIRTSMFLLGLCVVALVLGWLRLLTEQPALPTGSSYSTQPDGAEALLEWTRSFGRTTDRLQTLPVAGTPDVVFVIQPETPPSEKDFAEVTARGGTLVLAGDSVATFVFARALGVTFEPAPETHLHTPDGSLVLDATARLRLRAAGATPLLIGSSGDIVAARVAHGSGALIVLATPVLLSNAGLRDEATARFVLRELLDGGSNTGRVAFDEAHHSFAPKTSEQVTLEQLLFSSAAGRAILYAGLLTFGFIVLSGRRLGPPLPARVPAESQRTMYEHVQMLAGLYRRAGQLAAVRARCVSHYTRQGASAVVLARIAAAHSDAELIAAVAAADDAG